MAVALSALVLIGGGVAFAALQDDGAPDEERLSAGPTSTPGVAPVPPVPPEREVAVGPERVTGYVVTSTVTSYEDTSDELPPRQVGFTSTFEAPCTAGVCTVGRGPDDGLTVSFRPSDTTIDELVPSDDQCGGGPGYRWTGTRGPDGVFDLTLVADLSAFSPVDRACVDFRYVYELVLEPIAG